MKIGLFFGSFDPIHNGHLAIANHHLFTRLFSQIWFVVTPESPFKKNQINASYQHRINMLNLVINHQNNLLVSNVEASLPQPNYTSTTLRHLLKTFPNY